jgi:hypothetical protein
MIDTWVLYARWPVLERHPRAASWLQAWIDLGRAARTIDAYARGLAEYLEVCEQNQVDPVAARRPDVAVFVRHLCQRPNRRAAGPTLESAASVGLANGPSSSAWYRSGLFYDFLIEEGLRESNPVGRGRYSRDSRRQTAGSGQRGLVPRVRKLPWIPAEQQWLCFLADSGRNHQNAA